MPSQRIKIYDACRPHETNVYYSSGANSFPNTQWINKFQVRSGLLRILSGSGLSYRSACVFLEYHNSQESSIAYHHLTVDFVLNKQHLLKYT